MQNITVNSTMLKTNIIVANTPSPLNFCVTSADIARHCGKAPTYLVR